MNPQTKNDALKNMTAAAARLLELPVHVHLSVAAAAAVVGLYSAWKGGSMGMAYTLWLVVAPIFLVAGFNVLNREIKDLKLLTTPPIEALGNQGGRYARSVVLAYFGMNGYRPSASLNADQVPYDFALRKFGDKSRNVVLLRTRDWDGEPITLTSVKDLVRARGELERGQAFILTNASVSPDVIAAALRSDINILTPKVLIDLIQQVTGEGGAAEQAQAAPPAADS